MLIDRNERATLTTVFTFTKYRSIPGFNDLLSYHVPYTFAYSNCVSIENKTKYQLKQNPCFQIHWLTPHGPERPESTIDNCIKD